MAHDIDADSGRPFIKVNHPAPGDVVRNPAHIAGYGTAFEGTITGIAPSANTRNRVFEVEVTVPNPDGRLRPGMIAALDVGKAEFAVSTPVIPLAAVIRSPTQPDGYAVMTIEEQDELTLARVRDVELGDVLGNHVAVTRGLSPGEPVIVTGATLARDGKPVRVIP